jgi:hypothetical protein
MRADSVPRFPLRFYALGLQQLGAEESIRRAERISMPGFHGTLKTMPLEILIVNRREVSFTNSQTASQMDGNARILWQFH